MVLGQKNQLIFSPQRDKAHTAHKVFLTSVA